MPERNFAVHQVNYKRDWNVVKYDIENDRCYWTVLSLLYNMQVAKLR